MDTTKIYIYGASGHGKVIRDILEAQGKVVTGFIDDDILKTRFTDLQVIKVDQFNPQFDSIIMGIGINITRQQASSRISAGFINAVHPTSVISCNSVIGIGTVIMQLGVVQSGSVIGNHCIINTKASVDHDSTLGDFVHISPGATVCGNVTIGDLTWVDAGATIIHGIKIGKNSVIGAGAVVIDNVPDNVMVAGNPAIIKKTQLTTVKLVL